MPKLKKYTFYLCKDCEIDFVVAGDLKRINCPKCADSIYVETIKPVWLERPFNYKRKWTTDEDDMIIAGRRLGKTYKEIASELNGRTAKAVTQRMYLITGRKVISKQEEIQ